jgi:hypothetical protein
MRCGHEKGPATSRPSACLLAVKITLQDLDAGDRHPLQSDVPGDIADVHGAAGQERLHLVENEGLRRRVRGGVVRLGVRDFPPRCASLVASACAVAATNAMSLSRAFWTGPAVAPSKVKPLTPSVTEVAVLVRLLALPGNIGSA